MKKLAVVVALVAMVLGFAIAQTQNTPGLKAEPGEPSCAKPNEVVKAGGVTFQLYDNVGRSGWVNLTWKMAWQASQATRKGGAVEYNVLRGSDGRTYLARYRGPGCRYDFIPLSEGAKVAGPAKAVEQTPSGAVQAQMGPTYTWSGNSADGGNATATNTGNQAAEACRWNFSNVTISGNLTVSGCNISQSITVTAQGGNGGNIGNIGLAPVAPGSMAYAGGCRVYPQGASLEVRGPAAIHGDVTVNGVSRWRDDNPETGTVTWVPAGTTAQVFFNWAGCVDEGETSLEHAILLMQQNGCMGGCRAGVHAWHLGEYRGLLQAYGLKDNRGR